MDLIQIYRALDGRRDFTGGRDIFVHWTLLQRESRVVGYVPRAQLPAPEAREYIAEQYSTDYCVHMYIKVVPREHSVTLVTVYYERAAPLVPEI